VSGVPAHWGWHQLDEGWANRLVSQADIRPGDLVLDVGAGTGAITGPLVQAGARVIAFELHPARATQLRGRFDPGRVKVVVADAADLRLPRQPFRVVANPPFGITSALVRRLVNPHSQLVRADLVLPRWAAARWAAGRGAGGLPSKRGFVVAVTTRVPRSAFWPPPPDDAAIVAIERGPPRRR
jgi:23S rRNA (adenine-N6)-dimethyltransferase